MSGNTRPGFDFKGTLDKMTQDMLAASKVQVEQTDEQAAATYASEGLNGMMGGGSTTIGGLGNPTKQGTIPRSPDYYDPSGPDGPEPSDLQTSGPEKCTRLLNAWLYKCAISPL
jgi:hypothetical protein